MRELFDMELRAMRRDRAARIGPELFLAERVIADCLERIEMTGRRFGQALLIGCPDASWPERLGSIAVEVEARDPGPLFASEAGGELICEDSSAPLSDRHDLVLAIGTLDTVNDLPVALRLIRRTMSENSLFIGVMAGGHTLPQLRKAMLAADALAGAAAPHVHPRIEPSALAPLLESAGFAKPVVDVERVSVSYRRLARLVADLRAMAATNILHERGGSLSRRQSAAAAEAFETAGDGERTVETFELLYFAAWTAAKG